jgi:hypothetical protein
MMNLKLRTNFRKLIKNLLKTYMGLILALIGAKMTNRRHSSNFYFRAT